MPTFYHSESVQWSSKPKGKSHGKRNVVTIKNGKGIKMSMSLNAKGNPKKTKTVKLSKKEVNAAIKGSFIPGFWSNCKLGNCGSRT